MIVTLANVSLKIIVNMVAKNKNVKAFIKDNQKVFKSFSMYINIV